MKAESDVESLQSRSKLSSESLTNRAGIARPARKEIATRLLIYAAEAHQIQIGQGDCATAELEIQLRFINRGSKKAAQDPSEDETQAAGTV